MAIFRNEGVVISYKAFPKDWIWTPLPEEPQPFGTKLKLPLPFSRVIPRRKEMTLEQWWVRLLKDSKFRKNPNVEWFDFPNFKEDVGESPGYGYYLQLMYPNRGYIKGNYVWVK